MAFDRAGEVQCRLHARFLAGIIVTQD